jgi:hypothetical protein
MKHSILIPGLLLVIALVVLTAGCVSQTETIWNETAYIDDGYEIHYSFNVTDSPVTLQVSLETDGNPVDLIVLDEENFKLFDAGFSSGTFKNFRAIGSNPSVIETTQTYTLSEKDRYYVVIENADFLPNGANAGQGIKYSITITAS